MMTDHESSSSLSFMTTVPAFSTTAKGPPDPHGEVFESFQPLGELQQDLQVGVLPVHRVLLEGFPNFVVSYGKALKLE